jgi:hypothetical protein
MGGHGVIISPEKIMETQIQRKSNILPSIERIRAPKNHGDVVPKEG